jgi:hypothetical protein
MQRAVASFALVLFAVTGCHGAKQTDGPQTLGTSHEGAGSAEIQAKRAGGNDAPGEYAAEEADYGGSRGDSRDGAYAPTTSPPPSDPYAQREIVTERPGLGTSYGEHRSSSASTSPFVRQNSRRPDDVLTLWYDNAAGLREMVDWKGGYYDGSAWVRSPDGGLALSLLDEYGQGLQGVQVDDKRYAVGEAGQRYMIAIQNDSPYRYEAVASVDGLDVIDGDTASFKKRGYVVEPYTTTQIDGWRTSMDAVAAFRFSAIEQSYADRKGKGRNVGVIGVALFQEKVRRSPRELRQRDNANPFPG